jgi:hypothetical protein
MMQENGKAQALLNCLENMQARFRDTKGGFYAMQGQFLDMKGDLRHMKTDFRDMKML